MNKQEQELLMMFIKDGYKSATGKISKKTAIAMMKHVNSDSKLQSLVNNGDWKGVLTHKSKED